MKKLNNEQLLKISGGTKITAALISSIASGINSLLNLGRSLGTAIVRVVNKKTCSL